MDVLALVIFFIVISVLQGIGRLVEWLAEQQKLAQQQGQERDGEQGEAQTRAPSGRQRRQPQTPFEALMRYMEDQAREQQRPPEPPPAPPPQRPAAPPVVAAPERASSRGALAQHHLRSSLRDRPTRQGYASLGGRAQLTGFRPEDLADATSLEVIESLPPWQKAIVYTELLGKPRSQNPWQGKKL